MTVSPGEVWSNFGNCKPGPESMEDQGLKKITFWYCLKLHHSRSKIDFIDLHRVLDWAPCPSPALLSLVPGGSVGPGDVLLLLQPDFDRGGQDGDKSPILQPNDSLRKNIHIPWAQVAPVSFPCFSPLFCQDCCWWWRTRMGLEQRSEFDSQQNMSAEESEDKTYKWIKRSKSYRFTDASGSILSPLWPNNYLNSEACFYDIMSVLPNLKLVAIFCFYRDVPDPCFYFYYAKRSCDS